MWWLQFNQRTWPTAQARIVALGVDDEGAAEALDDRAGADVPSDSVGMALSYQFEVGGSTYAGSWPGGKALGGTLSKLLPEAWVARLEQEGVVDRTQFPERVTVALDGGDLAAGAQELLDSAGPEGGGEPVLEALVELAAAGVGQSMTIRYDPRNPSRSVPDYPGYGLRIPYLILALLCVALMFVYFIAVYPAWKRRSR